jgi:hypothetical protein
MSWLYSKHAMSRKKACWTFKLTLCTVGFSFATEVLLGSYEAPLKSMMASGPTQKWMKHPNKWVMPEPKLVPATHCHPGPYMLSNCCSKHSPQKESCCHQNHITHTLLSKRWHNFFQNWCIPVYQSHIIGNLQHFLLQIGSIEEDDGSL